MTKVTIAALALAMLVAAPSAFVAAPASAADMRLKALPPAVAPVPTWTGCYIGATAGGVWARSEFTWVASPFAPAPIGPNALVLDQLGSNTLKASGGTAGGEWGCNWQFNAFVVGYEGDFEWTGVHTTINTGCLACVFSVPSQGVEESISSRWLSTNRVRLGITNGPWLFYATGGLAVARVEFSDLVLISDLPGPPLANVVTSSNTKVGWTAGGGIEWLLFSNWSVKAEYLYVDLGSVTNVSVNTFNPNPANPTSITHTHNLREQIARVGLNYRFNWGKYPVAARY